MSAYCQGLTGYVAQWAVQKQKSHQQVGEQAMMSIEAMLNPNQPKRGTHKYNFLQKSTSKLKKCGNVLRRVFLDVFSPPDHDSDVHLPYKNLVLVLASLWTYAVRHCRGPSLLN